MLRQGVKKLFHRLHRLFHERVVGNDHMGHFGCRRDRIARVEVPEFEAYVDRYVISGSKAGGYLHRMPDHMDPNRHLKEWSPNRQSKAKTRLLHHPRAMGIEVEQ